MNGHTIELELPWPPSINGYWRTYGNRQILSKRGREFQAEAVACVADVVRLTGGYGSGLRLSVKLTLSPPDCRVRDLDNYCKATLDACTKGRLWADDSQIDRLVLERAGKCKGGKVSVSVQVLGDGDELTMTFN